LRPLPKPGGPVLAAARPVVIPTFKDVDPATLPAGARLVQLGAFDNEGLARSEWDRLALKFGQLLNGKGRVVQEAESAGRAFWRLRASGFADLDDARRFCSAVLAEEPALHCVPVAVRG
jgi:hypothetical protein